MPEDVPLPDEVPESPEPPLEEPEDDEPPDEPPEDEDEESLTPPEDELELEEELEDLIHVVTPLTVPREPSQGGGGALGFNGELGSIEQVAPVLVPTMISTQGATPLEAEAGSKEHDAAEDVPDTTHEPSHALDC